MRGKRHAEKVCATGMVIHHARESANLEERARSPSEVGQSSEWCEAVKPLLDVAKENHKEKAARWRAQV